jgi:hypothetical protein
LNVIGVNPCPVRGYPLQDLICLALLHRWNEVHVLFGGLIDFFAREEGAPNNSGDG